MKEPMETDNQMEDKLKEAVKNKTVFNDEYYYCCCSPENNLPTQLSLCTQVTPQKDIKY